MQGPLFVEEQRFTQPLLILLDLALTAFVILAIALGGSPVVTIVIAAATVLFLATARLRVEVVPGVIKIRFWPLARRDIAIAAIESAATVSYRPIRQYGGWGVRRARDGGAYSVRGNRGVRVELKGDGHVLIGSQRPEELAAAIESLRR